MRGSRCASRTAFDFIGKVKLPHARTAPATPASGKAMEGDSASESVSWGTSGTAAATGLLVTSKGGVMGGAQNVSKKRAAVQLKPPVPWASPVQGSQYSRKGPSDTVALLMPSALSPMVVLMS